MPGGPCAGCKRLLDDKAVMSRAEVRSTARIAGLVGDRKSPGYGELVKRLKIKVSQVSADDATRELVEKL